MRPGVGQQPLLRHHARLRAGRLRRGAVELQPHQRPGVQRRDQQVALPVREQLAGVEGHAARRDHRVPEVDRLLEAEPRAHPRADRRAVVVAAVADLRPAEVQPRSREVQLVAALRPVLDGPERARPGMDRRALHVAMPEAPDALDGAGLADERVVGRRRPVGPQPHHLAVARREILGQHPLLGPAVLAGGDVEGSVAVEEHPRAVVLRRSATAASARRCRSRPRSPSGPPTAGRAPRRSRSGRRRAASSRSSRPAGPPRSPARPRRRAARPGRRACTAGTPASGSETAPSAATIRIRPGRSVTRSAPSGSNAMPQGCSRPPATSSTPSVSPDPASGARVCSGNAGSSSGALRSPCATGPPPLWAQASGTPASTAAPAATATPIVDLTLTSPRIGLGRGTDSPRPRSVTPA